MSEEKLDSIVADLPKRGKLDSIVADFLDRDDVDLPRDGERLREALMPHVGKPPSNKLPENSGAITGSYTEEEAKKWIADLHRSYGATSDFPIQDGVPQKGS